MYTLISENLTNLGGPMGSEYTFDNYRKSFLKLETAINFAEKEYGKEIIWKKDDKTGELCSGDLSYVMYTIKPIKFEDE